MPTMRKITDVAVIAQMNSAKRETVKIKVNMRPSDRVNPDMDMYSTIVLKYSRK